MYLPYAPIQLQLQREILFVFEHHLNNIMLMHGRCGLGLLSTTIPSVNAGCQPVSNDTDYLHTTIRKALLLQAICFSSASADEV